jgi:hypothetical protein
LSACRRRRRRDAAQHSEGLMSFLDSREAVAVWRRKSVPRQEGARLLTGRGR